jgi:hypothetical protein
MEVCPSDLETEKESITNVLEEYKKLARGTLRLHGGEGAHLNKDKECNGVSRHARYCGKCWGNGKS